MLRVLVKAVRNSNVRKAVLKGSAKVTSSVPMGQQGATVLGGQIRAREEIAKVIAPTYTSLIGALKNFAFIPPKKTEPVKRLVEEAVADLIKDVTDHFCSYIPERFASENVAMKVGVGISADWLMQLLSKRLNIVLVAAFSKVKDKDGNVDQASYDEIKRNCLPILLGVLLLIIAAEHQISVQIYKKFNRDNHAALNEKIQKIESDADLFEHLMDEIRDNFDEHTLSYESLKERVDGTIAAINMIDLMVEELREDAPLTVFQYLEVVRDGLYANLMGAPSLAEDYLKAKLGTEDDAVARRILKRLRENEGDITALKMELKQELQIAEGEYEKEEAYLLKQAEKMGGVTDKMTFLQKAAEGVRGELVLNQVEFDRLHRRDFVGRLFGSRKVVSEEEEGVKLKRN